MLTLLVKSAEHAPNAPKIQRLITIMVRWGYDSETDEAPEEED